MIVARIVSGVTDHFVKRAPEWFMTYMLGQFGLGLLTFGHVFSNTGYSTMAHLANETVWGCACIAVAVARLAALIANGTFHRFRRLSPLVRSIGAGLSAFAWFAIALGLFASGRPGFGTYLGLLVADFYLGFWIVAGEAAVAERVHRNASAGSRRHA